MEGLKLSFTFYCLGFGQEGKDTDIVTCAILNKYLSSWCNWWNAIVPTFISCTECVGSPGIMNDRTPDCHPVFQDMNIALNCKLRWSLMCLVYFSDMLSMGVCTTRQLQTSSRPVQELNVCSVLTLAYNVLPSSLLFNSL